jgi:uncharacterized CHY-type Zn-finger protein
MKVFKYLQNIFDKHVVIVEEVDIEPKPVLCDVCRKESTQVIVSVSNPTGEAKDIKNCIQTMRYYCDEHGKATP